MRGKLSTLLRWRRLGKLSERSWDLPLLVSNMGRKALTVQVEHGQYEEENAVDAKEQLKRLKRLYRLIFIFSVVVPSFIVAFYFIFFASNQYLSEARFVVRTIGVSTSDDEKLDDSSKLATASSTTEDAYIVANFLKSPEIVERLDKRLDLRSLFSRDEADFWSSLSPNASKRTLSEYWEKQSIAYVDGLSGIIVLQVRAFTPEDALKINQAALQEASQMVSTLSDRAKNDLVHRAEEEVAKALIAYQHKLLKLSEYQKEIGILSPLASAKVTKEISASLLEEKLKTESQLAVLKARGVANSPLKRQLEGLIKNLDKQIQNLIDRPAGVVDGSTSLSTALTKFSGLETERIVAQNLYQAARKNLDIANSTAMRRTTFLSVFSPPRAAEEASYPKRLSSILIAITTFFILWGTARLTWASVEDHRR